MERDAMARIVSFEYPDHPAPASPVLEALGLSGPPPSGSMRTLQAADKPTTSAFESRIAEEKQRSFEAGRAQGIEEGRRSDREVQRAALQAEESRRRTQVAAVVTRMDEERERYMHAVEQEVVSLALAIAARILRREAQMDPLLLTGAVRVALGQLTRTSEARLKVPAAEAAMWQETIMHLPNLAVRPAIVPMPEMDAGECELETTLGSVDLGLRAQLAEIERGFFDRVGRERRVEQVPNESHAAMGQTA
jgi:flagellar assembly protein FliH